MGLKGRVIVITGAARGIGRACAELAFAEGAGHLVLTDRDATALAPVAAALGAMPVVADLADPADAARIMPAAVAQWGRVDGLINAAGITTRASVASGTLADWDALFDAVAVRLSRTVGEDLHNPPEVAIHSAALTASLIQAVVLDCVAALDQLHVALKHERSQRLTP